MHVTKIVPLHTRGHNHARTGTNQGFDAAMDTQAAILSAYQEMERAAASLKRAHTHARRTLGELEAALQGERIQRQGA